MSLVDIFTTSGTLLYSFPAYASTFTGGVNVAVGNVTNNGSGLDIITAPQFGVQPVEVWHISNLTTTPTATLVRSFFPYGSTFTGGISVGAGDFNLDGNADVVTSPYSGIPVQVKIYSGAAISNPATAGGSIRRHDQRIQCLLASTFIGGATVAVGDVDGDGVPDVVVAAGLLGSSQVVVMSGASIAAGGSSIAELAGFQVFTNAAAPTPAAAASITKAPLSIALEDVNGSGRDVLVRGARGPGGNADAIDILLSAVGQSSRSRSGDLAADHRRRSFRTAPTWANGPYRLPTAAAIRRLLRRQCCRALPAIAGGAFAAQPCLWPAALAFVA